jgi:hypothetical protein
MQVENRSDEAFDASEKIEAMKHFTLHHLASLLHCCTIVNRHM